MNCGQTHVRLVAAGAIFAVFALIAGCGSEYRPVVTPISPNGPAAQPSSLAIVVSAPSPSTAGIATVIDYSGDTVMATATIGPGPISFTLDQTGTTGYTVNSNGTLTNFPATTNLQAKNVNYTTLPVNSQPIGLFSPSAGLLAADLCNGTCNNIDVLTGIPESLNLTIPISTSPVAVVGPGTIGERVYSITQGASTAANPMACNLTPHAPSIAAGSALAIENALHTISATIPLGACPVFGVVSADNRRTFVLNRGSDTVTVINSQNNTLDACTPFVNQSGQTVTCHPALPLSQAALGTPGMTPPVNCNIAADPTCGGMPAVAGPVYAELNTATSQLVVADYEGGTISVIDVSLDVYGNDSSTFGTTYTVPVGNFPASVTVLADGSRAYTANQLDQTVTIVNLSSHTVEKTLPVTGHPRTVVSTQNSIYGKVYVASPDSPVLTIIRTDQDTVGTTVVSGGGGGGNIVDVRVSTQTGTSGNSNNNSRLPGYGQPCNLPPPLVTGTTLQACQTLP